MEEYSWEKTIDWRDMFWAICQRWRGICLTALICAVFAGGIGYIRNSQTENTGKRAEEKISMSELDEEDLGNIQLYLDFFESYRQQLLYNHKAPLMKLDANEFYVGTLDYYVDNYYEVEYPLIEKNSNLSAIVLAYKSTLGKDSFGAKLQEELGLGDLGETSYVLEYVDCTNAYGMKTENASSSGVMRVSVYAQSEEMCIALKEFVKAELEQCKAEMTAQFGRHDISLTGESCNLFADNGLINYQKTNTERLYTLNTNLANVKKLLSDEAKAYVDQRAAEYIEVEDLYGMAGVDAIRTSEPAVSIKLVLVGMVAGSFVFCAVVALSYIMNNRLLYEDDFEELYGVKLLGRIERKKQEKWFGFLDTWILGLRRKHLHRFEEEEAMRMIYTGVKLAAEKVQIVSIYVTGSDLDGYKDSPFVQLLPEWEKVGIHVEIGESILYYADSLARVAKAGGVVLLEKAEQSMYQEIRKELTVCQQQGVCVLGAVVME